MLANLSLLFEPLWQTLYMVLISSLLASLLGIPLGILLYTTLCPAFFYKPRLNALLSFLVDAARSLPFIILLIAIIPLTRLFVGTSIGTTAAIVPLSLAAIPFVARLTESALNAVSTGLIEASLAMGANKQQVIFKVLLPEARVALVKGLTMTTINLVGYSAMAGTMGGGGLGDLAIRYGYQRFESDIMVTTVIVLIGLVKLIQFVGDKIAAYYVR